MKSELMKYNNAQIIHSVDDLGRIGKMMAISGYFQDARDAAQASVKIMAGMEMGFGPFASMTGIYIIKGNPSVGANLMASAVKNNPKYDFRVRKMEDDEVAIEFFERIDGKYDSLGISKFSKEDAQRAGTQNMGKFPRNMLFARAISNGIRWFCPDVFNGSVAYTPDELGAQVDDDGNVTDIPQVVDVQPEPETELETPEPVEPEAEPEPAPEPEKPAFDEIAFLQKFSRPSWVSGMNRAKAEGMLDRNGEAYGDKDTEELFHMFRTIVSKIDTASEDKKAVYKEKIEAICEILQCRKVEKTYKEA